MPCILSYSPAKFNRSQKWAEKAGVRLTKRQAEVLFWAAHGKTDWEVGVLLGIDAETVKYHRMTFAEKIGLKSFTHALCWAIENRIIRVRREGEDRKVRVKISV